MAQITCICGKSKASMMGVGGGEVRAGKLDASVFPPSPPLPALWEDNGGV